MIRSVFPKGFYINGEHIDVSAKSRGEFTNSTESRNLSFFEPEVYADKMRTSPYLDIISQNTQYAAEATEHTRKDNIFGFERGPVNLIIGNNYYSADVIIGIKKDGSKIFYDISNIKKTKTTPSEPEPNSRTSEQLGVVFNNSIPNLEEDVNKALKAEEGNFLEQRGEGAKIEPEEEAAVLDYKSSLAYILNEKLRSNIELSSEEKNAVNSLDKALSKMPKYRGTVYRNIGFDIQGQEVFNEFAKSYSKGETVKYPAYTSASKVQNGYEIEDHLRAHFEIIGKNCRDTKGFGSDTEAEVIFSRNSRFKVIFSEIKDGTVNIKLEEIENGNGLLEGQVPHDTLHGGAALLEMQAPGERRRSSSEMRGIPGGDTAGDIGREAGPQAAASGGPRDTVRTEGQGIEERAGAKSAGFFDGEKARTEAPGKTEDKYAPFYKKGVKPEGNTVGAKESTTQFWTSGVQYGTHEPKTRQTYEGNELFEAPKRLSDDGTKEVSQAVESVAASPIGTRETLDYMIQNIDKFTHAVDTDIDSVNKAKSYLETNGIESAMKYWKDISEGKQKYTKDDGVLAATTIRLLQEQGRQAEANRMTAELVAEISTAAQATQGAEAIYKILDPASMKIATNSEYYVKSLTEKLNEIYKKRLGGKEIEVDKELLDKALEANGSERQGEAWDRVYSSIANQVPASFWERLNNIRYFCMLSNPRTHIRNTVSNLAMYGISGVKNGVKAVVEAAYNSSKAVKSGKAEESRTASLRKAPKEYREFAKEDFKLIRDINETGKYSETTSSFVTANRTKINGNILSHFIKARFKGDSKAEAAINKVLDQGVFNSLAEFNSYMLGEVEDGGAKSMIYTRAMSQYMQANGLTPEFLRSEAGETELQKARAYASAEALYNTFNEANHLADAISKLESSNAFTRIFLGSTLPFKKVPLNLVKTGFDYSPAGLITSSAKIIKAVSGKGADVDVNAAIDGAAKGITGTGVLLAGMLLRSLGYLTNGLSDDDKEANFEKLQGAQAFALKLPDGSTYSLDFLQPAGMMLFSGAAAYDTIKDIFNGSSGIIAKDESGGIDTGKTLSNFADIGINAIASFYEPMVEMSMLENLKEMLIDGNSTSVPEFIVDTLGDFANQFIPQFLSALSKTLDDTQRNPYYVDKTNNVPDSIEKHINIAKSKIPRLSQSLPEKVDNWGRVQENDTNITVRIFENFISPGTYKQNQTTEVDKYIEQLYVKTGDKAILPSSMAKNFSVEGERTDLSAKQYSEAQKVKGQTAFKTIEEAIENKSFRALSPEQQAKILSDIYSYSTALAKREVSDYQIEGWIKDAVEAKKDGLSTDDYITLRNLKNSLEKTEDKSVSEQFFDKLSGYGLSDKGKVTALGYINKVDIDEYREVLESDKDILSAYRVIVNGGNKEENVEEMKEALGKDENEAFGIYSALAAGKSYKGGQFTGFGSTQLPKAEKLVEEKGWKPEDVALAARAVTGLGTYLGKNKTKKAYVQALMAVGFTEKEANEFYSTYGW